MWPKYMMRRPKRWPMRNRDRALKGLRDLIEGIEDRKSAYYQGADIYLESREVTSWAVDRELTDEAYDA